MAKFQGEQRKALRRNIKLDGIAATHDGRRLSCRIRDISDTGARIEFKMDDDVPDEFALIIGGNEDVRRLCTVVRRIDRSVGVRFPERAPPPH